MALIKNVRMRSTGFNKLNTSNELGDKFNESFLKKRGFQISHQKRLRLLNHHRSPLVVHRHVSRPYLPAEVTSLTTPCTTGF